MCDGASGTDRSGSTQESADAASHGVDEITKHIKKIWKRARTNAFAHKIAGERAQKNSTHLICAEFIATVLAITFIIFLYMVSGSDARWAGRWATLFTILSIIFTVIGLCLQFLQVHFNYAVVSARHNHNLGSFQYIAQRAREVDWPEKPRNEKIELLRDLERDFQLLKARGNEPSDHDFDLAAELLKKISDNEFTKSMQSFNATED